jgi:hypothetical protein
MDLLTGRSRLSRLRPAFVTARELVSEAEARRLRAVSGTCAC